MMLSVLHPGVISLALIDSSQLNLFEQFLTQAVSGIDSTSITSGMQNVGYVILVVGFLWQVYQSALHGGDVRGLGASLIKYVATAVVVMNYHAVFTTINQGFVDAGNWISNASGALNLLDNWRNDIQTQFSQVGFQQMWGLVTGSIAGLIDAILILVAYLLYPLVIVIFGFFYILYGSILYIFGPLVISLMPLGATNRIAKAYVENVFIWNAWPILYGGFGALLSAVQMGQVGQMLSQNSFLGGLGSLEGSFLIGFASIIFSLAIAVIPFMAKRIVSGDVGSTAGMLIGAAVTAITAGTAAIEGAAVGAAAASAGSAAGASGNAASSAGVVSAGGKPPAGMGSGNQPVPSQRGVSPGGSSTSAGNQPAMDTKARNTSAEVSDGTEQMDDGSPTAEGHAGHMRSSLMSAAGHGELASDREDSTGAQQSPAPVRGSGSGSGSGSGFRSRSAAPTFASVNRGNPWAWSSYAPHPRRDGIATWGAYHAARVATQAAVTGRRAIDNAGKASD
jgi:hypothetical protein